jgi:hypothetical protein
MTPRTQYTLFLSLSIAALAAVAGCGSESSSASAPITDAPVDAASTTDAADATDVAVTEPVPSDTAAGEAVLPFHPGELDAGTYAGNKFAHPVTFVLDNGWEGDESPDSLLIFERLPDDSVLEFGGAIGLLAPALDMSADEVVAALRTTVGVEFSEPTESSLTGLDGVALTAGPVAEEVVFDWIYDPAFESPWYAFAGEQHEVHVLDHPSGTMIVWISSLPDGWDGFRVQAQAVLDSIVWSE